MQLCVWVFDCLFGCLLIHVSLCFLGWLVVWVVYGLCVLVCFSAPAAHFRGLLAHLETLLCFSSRSQKPSFNSRGMIKFSVAMMGSFLPLHYIIFFVYL